MLGGILVTYVPNEARYNEMKYNRLGNSGLKLSAISLGLWHNFGGVDQFEKQRAILRRAFDLGITHFDLANNYGPPAGSAEENFGMHLKKDFAAYRDEMVISTKAGYYMWPGPYGDEGSKKYLVSSLDQSLKRMGLDYVDIFYHHRMDMETSLEETMGALDLMVRQGKVLYAGVSNYNPERLKKASDIMKQLGTPLLIHQPKYSMFARGAEDLFGVHEEERIGSIAFSPLAQGLLTDKYLNGIPTDSRAAGASIFLKEEMVTPEVVAKVRKLNDIAVQSGQTMAQMALAWVLRGGHITSVLIGASKEKQIDDAVGALANPDFTATELAQIDKILKD